MYVVYAPPCLGKTTLVKKGLLPLFYDTDEYHLRMFGDTGSFLQFKKTSSDAEVLEYEQVMITTLSDEGYIGVITNMTSLLRRYSSTCFAVVVKPSTYLLRVRSSDRPDLTQQFSDETLVSWAEKAWVSSYKVRARYELQKGEWLSDVIAKSVSLFGLNPQLRSIKNESDDQTVR